MNKTLIIFLVSSCVVTKQSYGGVVLISDCIHIKKSSFLAIYFRPIWISFCNGKKEKMFECFYPLSTRWEISTAFSPRARQKAQRPRDFSAPLPWGGSHFWPVFQTPPQVLKRYTNLGIHRFEDLPKNILNIGIFNLKSISPPLPPNLHKRGINSFMQKIFPLKTVLF